MYFDDITLVYLSPENATRFLVRTKMKPSGKIKHIGVCSIALHNVECLRDLSLLWPEGCSLKQEAVIKFNNFVHIKQGQQQEEIEDVSTDEDSSHESNDDSTDESKSMYESDNESDELDEDEDYIEEDLDQSFSSFLDSSIDE